MSIKQVFALESSKASEFIEINPKQRLDTLNGKTLGDVDEC